MSLLLGLKRNSTMSVNYDWLRIVKPSSHELSGTKKNGIASFILDLPCFIGFRLLILKCDNQRKESGLFEAVVFGTLSEYSLP